MSKRRLASCAVAVGVALPLPVPAQNVLPNPDFHIEIAPWSSDDVESWSALDRDGCTGSGAMEIECTNVGTSFTHTGCLQFSGDTAHVALSVAANLDEPGTEEVVYLTSMYSDTDCQTLLGGFPIGGQALPDINTTYQTFEFTQDVLDGTQSIQVQFLVGGFDCLSPGKLLFFDSLYYGEMHRIFAHGFESEELCPFTATD